MIVSRKAVRINDDQSIRVEVRDAGHGIQRLDIRRFDGPVPGPGFNVSARVLGDLCRAIVTVERECLGSAAEGLASSTDEPADSPANGRDERSRRKGSGD